MAQLEDAPDLRSGLVWVQLPHAAHGDIERVYGPYWQKPKGNSIPRQIVIIIFANGVRKTTSYARFLLEQQLGRWLTGDEQADHKDNDPINDDVVNVQILSRNANVLKYTEAHPAEIGTYTCPWCSEQFTKRISVVHGNRSQGKVGPFCGKSCAGSYSQTFTGKNSL